MKRKPAREGLLAYTLASFSLLSKQPYAHVLLPFCTLPQPSPSDFLLRAYDIFKNSLLLGAEISITLDAAFSSNDLLETLSRVNLQYVVSVNTAWHNEITKALSFKLQEMEYRVWYNEKTKRLALCFHDKPTSEHPEKEKYIHLFTSAFAPVSNSTTTSLWQSINLTFK